MNKEGGANEEGGGSTINTQRQMKYSKKSLPWFDDIASYEYVTHVIQRGLIFGLTLEERTIAHVHTQLNTQKPHKLIELHLINAIWLKKTNSVNMWHTHIFPCSMRERYR